MTALGNIEDIACIPNSIGANYDITTDRRRLIVMNYAPLVVSLSNNRHILLQDGARDGACYYRSGRRFSWVTSRIDSVNYTYVLCSQIQVRLINDGVVLY